QYRAQVYDVSGQCLTPPKAHAITMDRDKAHYIWQTQASTHRPSLCSFSLDGQNLGCILFDRPEPLKPATGTAVLAVDFGTTSTTGAMRLSSHANAAIVAPAFPSSVLHWVMNEQEGSKWSLEQFVADRFNTLDSHGVASPFFTSIARFSSAADGVAPNSIAAPDNELFQDGHIYYFGKNDTSADNLMGSQRFFSLKLKDIGDIRTLSGSNVSLFLQQVLETYMLFCRMQGATVSEVRFAYPLAFNPDKQKQFRDNVEALVTRIAPQVGSPGCKVFSTSESQAVSAYFCAQRGIMQGVAEQGVITLDIGGGTSDYSFCRVNPQQTLCYCYSNYLAGHLMLGEYAYSCKKRSHLGALNWYFNGCREVAEHATNDNDKQEIKKLKVALDSKEALNKENFIFYIERFISLNPDLYRSLLLTDDFKDQYTLLLFELTLLLWFGYLLGTQPWAAFGHTPVCIHLGGNGAHLYDMLKPEDLDAICALIPTPGGVRLVKDINQFRKREVAEGLLQNEDLLTVKPETEQANCAQSSTELLEAFQALCGRFLAAFAEREGASVAYLQSLEQENKRQFENRFLQKVTSFPDLFRYLYDFCTMMIEDIISYS
ncbi:MAG: hypothetical protein PHO41_07185, partial [Eubacteriales bacterium]|nr:hypothetical protein [Eubacteriales bacterium]